MRFRCGWSNDLDRLYAASSPIVWVIERELVPTCLEQRQTEFVTNPGA